MDFSGGEVLANALSTNSSLRMLCIADNKIGAELAALISGKLVGNITDIIRSFCAKELLIPNIHKEKVKRRGGAHK